MQASMCLGAAAPPCTASASSGASTAVHFSHGPHAGHSGGSLRRRMRRHTQMALLQPCSPSSSPAGAPRLLCCTRLLHSTPTARPCLRDGGSAGHSGQQEPLLGQQQQQQQELLPQVFHSSTILQPHAEGSSSSSPAACEEEQPSSSSQAAAPHQHLSPTSSTSSQPAQEQQPAAAAAAAAAATTALEASGSTQGESSSSSSGNSSSSSSSGAGHEGEPAPVADALARVQDTLQQLESSLDGIPNLPSSSANVSADPLAGGLQPTSRAAHALRLARKAALVATCSVAVVASHAFGLAVQLLSSVAGSAFISYWGHRRGSLSASGAVVAFMVGVGSLGCSLRLGASLLAFYFSASEWTHFKEEKKANLDDSSKKGGRRGWKQVLCNGLAPTCMAVVYGIVAGCVDVPLGPSPQLEAWRAKLLTLLAGAYLGWYGSCCGDTWASEVGPLSSTTPRLITDLRPVRRGTNGGVTLLGLAASAAGGLFMGLVFYGVGVLSPTLWIFEAQRATAIAQWPIILLGVGAGLVGSLADSLLGATVQFTGFNHTTQRVTSTPGQNVTAITGMPLLDNNMVNVVSAAFTAVLTALATLKVFGP